MEWWFGEIINHELRTGFVKLDERMFTKYELNVDNFLSKEELVEAIESLNLDEKNMYEIVLVGNRRFTIEPRQILKLIAPSNVLKIKDNTQIGYDIEKIAEQNNLRGMFIRKIIEKCKNGKYTEGQIKKAIELGLEVM